MAVTTLIARKTLLGKASNSYSLSYAQNSVGKDLVVSSRVASALRCTTIKNLVNTVPSTCRFGGALVCGWFSCRVFDLRHER